MRTWVRVLLFLVAVGAATVFAVVHGGQRVWIDLGVVRFRGVSLPVVVFASVLLGMILTILAGLRADLRTRRLLRRYRELADRDHYRDA